MFTGMVADWIVGGVACLLGMAALWNAALEDSGIYHLPKLRWIEQRYGRPRARAVLMVIGTLLIIGGIAIALGFKLNWSE